MTIADAAAIASAVAALVSAWAAVRALRPKAHRRGDRRGVPWWWFVPGSLGLPVLAWSAALGIVGWALVAVCLAGAISGAVLQLIRTLRRMNSPLLTGPAAELVHRSGSGGGLPYRFDTTAGIERVYSRRSAGPGVDPPTSATMSTDSLLWFRSDRLLLVGEPGIGKSTLLSQVAAEQLRWWSTAAQRDAGLKQSVPLLLAAVELVGHDDVVTAFAERLDVDASLLREPPHRRAHWLFMVDAVDEIADIDARHAVIELLAEHLNRLDPRVSRLLITARSLRDDHWRELSAAGGSVWRLLPFDDDQLCEFISRYRCADPTDDTAKHSANREARTFVTAMRDRNMLELVRLPLLARLTADAYFESGAVGVPARRVDIYHQTVARLLGKFTEMPAGHDPGTRDRIRALLDRIGQRWDDAEVPGSTGGLGGFLRALAGARLADDRRGVTALALDLLDAEPTEARTVNALLTATGVLVDIDAPRFLHRTFAEYLDAPALAERLGTDVAPWPSRLLDGATRVAAVFAFDRLTDRDREQLLQGLTEHEDWRLLSAAVLVAEGLCDTAEADRIVERYWRLPSWDMLRDAGRLLIDNAGHRDRLAALVRDSVHHSGGERVLAALLLIEHDSARHLPLLRALADDPALLAYDRLVALRFLSPHDPATTADRLGSIADDHRQDGDHRATAAVMLHGTDIMRALPALTELITDPTVSPEARNRCRVALGEREPAAPLINELLDSPQQTVEQRGHLVALLLTNFVDNPALAAPYRLSAIVELHRFDPAMADDRLTALLADRRLDAATRAQADRARQAFRSSPVVRQRTGPPPDRAATNT